jgi:aspartate/methionine/tyrosine aminotransferase
LENINIEYFKPEGTYFILMYLKELVKSSGLTNDFEFAKMVCGKYGLAFVPASSFFVDNYKTNGIFRMHFAKNDDVLNKALERIETMKKKLI